jgi:mono/diheme cytochrome c family protein
MARRERRRSAIVWAEASMVGKRTCAVRVIGLIASVGLLWAGIMPPVVARAQAPTYGVGRAPTLDEIRALGFAIPPSGTGLPAGSGTVAAGREVFAQQCARCHGPNGEGDVGARLVGGQGSLATPRPVRTVGSFWPYATTLWDYVNRAMPFDKPGLLEPPEVYAVVAFLLNLNGIVAEDRVIDAQSLPAVRMPNRDGFVPDARPDVPKGDAQRAAVSNTPATSK